MERREEIIRELQDISPSLVKLPLNQPFALPDGYFDGLAAAMLRNILASEAPGAAEELQVLSPLLAGISKTPPFAAPESYFEETPDNVLDGVNAIDFVQAELEILPGPLAALQHVNVYEVPEGYFEGLPAAINRRLKRKVFRLADFSRRLGNVAIAAALTGVLVLGTWLLTKTSPGSLTALTGGEPADIESRIQNVSDAEIRNYIENNAVPVVDAGISSTQVLDEQDMKEMVADISDEAIAKYLDDYGVTREYLTN